MSRLSKMAVMTCLWEELKTDVVSMRSETPIDSPVRYDEAVQEVKDLLRDCKAEFPEVVSLRNAVVNYERNFFSSSEESYLARLLERRLLYLKFGTYIRDMSEVEKSLFRQYQVKEQYEKDKSVIEKHIRDSFVKELMDFTIEQRLERVGARQSVSIPFDVIEEILALSEDCKQCLAIKSCLSAYVSVEQVDTPERDANWAKQNKCCNLQHNPSCSVYRLSDWVNRFKEPGVLKSGFLSNLKRFVLAGATAYKLATSLSSGAMKVVQAQIRSSPYIVFATLMEDQLMSKNGSQFFSDLYFLRVNFGLNGDYGMKHAFMAEGETETFYDKILNIVSALRTSKPIKTLEELVRLVVSKVFGFFEGLVSLVSDLVTPIITKLRQKLVNFVLSVLVPEEILEKIQDSALGVIIVNCVTLLSVVAMGVCSFFSYKILVRLVQMLSTTSSMIAEGPLDIVTLTVSSIMGVFGLKNDNLEYIRKRCLQMIALVAGGTIITNSAASLFMVLPSNLRRALVLRFGTNEQANKMRLDDWNQRALALLSVRTVPRVVCSDYYLEAVKKATKVGIKLMKATEGSNLRAFYFGTFSRLMSLHTILTQREQQCSSRPMPFAIHLAGRPGLGKTLVLTSLIRQGFGKDPNSDVYNRSNVDDYWSGFLGQTVVVMDEFLVGDQNAIVEKAKEYLTLVSTNQFLPSMPSVDNVSVGMKGTEARPDLVITLNNTTYDRPVHINADAFQRRRKFVIEFAPSKDFRRGRGDLELDLSKYSVEEIRQIKWLRFRMSCGFRTDEPPGPWITFEILCSELKKFYQEHREICGVLAEAFGKPEDFKEDPKEIIDDILRESFDLPNENPGVIEAFGSMFKSEGLNVPIKEPSGPLVKHEHRCCLTPYLCSGGTKDFVCHKCHKSQNCEKLVLALIKNKAVSHEHECCGIKINDCTNWKTNTCVKCNKALFCSKERVKAAKEEDLYPVEDSNNHTVENGVPHIHRCIVANCTKGVICRVNTNYTNARCQFHSNVSESETFVAINHDGIDPKKMHNHKCSYLDCSKVVTHSHDEKEHHLMFCLEHVIYRNVPSEMSALAPSGLRPDIEKMTINNVIDYRVACIKQVIDYAKTRNLYFLTSEKPQHQNIRRGAVIGLIIGLFIGIKAYLRGKEEPPLTMKAESARPNKSSRNRGQQLKLKRGMRSEGSDGVPTLKMTIGPTRTVNVIPIKGRWLLTFKHAFADRSGLHRDDVPLIVEYRDKKFKADFNESFCYSGEDIILFEFRNPQFPQFKDITSKFITGEEVDTIHGPIQVLLRSEEGTKYSTAVKRDSQNYQHSGMMVEIGSCWKYNMPTAEGHCGLPLVVASGPYMSKILGFHVAGSTVKGPNACGASILVTKEMISDCLEMEPEEPVFHNDLFVAEGVYEDFTENNKTVMKVQKIGQKEIVHLSDKSKIQESLLHGKLDQEPLKRKPILTQADPRSKGQDPASGGLIRALNNERREYDHQITAEIFEEILNNYNNNLDFGPVGRRQLTFEEALKGVPGWLSSIKTDTSPGYPWVYTKTKKGKQDFVWFDAKGELGYTPELKRLVTEKVYEMENYDGGPINHRFLGYLKDELISESKEKDARMRLIFANNFVSYIAFRMKFGAVLGAFNNSSRTTTGAISLNQYSHDMQVVYDSLTDNFHSRNFGDGDFKNLDQNHQKQFNTLAYGVFLSLARSCGVTRPCLLYFYNHETNSPVQVKDLLVEFDCYHFSGLFLTTIINNIIVEAYFRYCLIRHNMTTMQEDFDFDEEMRLKVLGDDNIYNISDDLRDSGFHPQRIGELMRELGQTYTSAKKDEPLPDHCLGFHELTFLGAHPVKVSGRWSGAMKKDTLWETIQWTRDHNLSLDQTVISMIECASQWDEKFFDEYVSSVKKAYKEIDRPFPKIPSYLKLRRVVSERTASKGVLFSGLQAEGLEDEIKPTMQKGLTSFSQTRKEVIDGDDLRSRLSALAIQQPGLDIEYGLRSFVFRETISWTNATGAGENLASFRVPEELLAMGKDNLQNMPFNRFAYAEFDIEIMIQLNGTPFQQGALYCFFYPLDTVYHTLNLFVVLSMPGVWLTPNENTTGIVKIPFRFWRSILPLGSGEQLGRFYITVVSPLVSASGDQSCSVSLFSKFENYKFHLPRPYTPLTSEGLDDLITSKSSGKESYNIRGSSLPIHQSFSSMSRTVGPETTVGMLAAQEQNAEEPEILRKGDTDIQGIMMKPSLIVIHSWSTTDATGAILVQVPINSVFSPATFPIDLSPQLALLNGFMFFRADFVFTIRLIKTKYHSGRLFVGCAYGASNVVAADRVGYPTEVIDLDDVDMHVMTASYNAPTEFLRTFNGLVNANTTMGMFILGVQTQLRAASTVAGSVTIIVTVQLENLQVYEARSDSSIAYPTAAATVVMSTVATTSTTNTNTTVTAKSPDSTVLSSAMKSEALDEPIVLNPVMADEQPIENVALTDMKSRSEGNLIRGRKFEYQFSDVTDLMRRHRLIGISGFIRGMGVGPTGSLTGHLYWFNVLPTKYKDLFAAWSGTIKYRLFFDATSTPSIPISFVAHQFGSDYDERSIYGIDMVAHALVHPELSATTNYTVRQGGIYSSRPTERTFPLLSENTATGSGISHSFIDVSVPFNTNLSFLSNLEVAKSNEPRFPRQIGTLVYFIKSTTTPVTDIYISVGDDFKYHIWRPAPGNYQMVVPTNSATLSFTTGTNINGFVSFGTNTVAPP